MVFWRTPLQEFQQEKTLKSFPDLPVPYIFGTKLPVANISGNDRPLVPNIKGTGRSGFPKKKYRKRKPNRARL